MGGVGRIGWSGGGGRSGDSLEVRAGSWAAGGEGPLKVCGEDLDKLGNRRGAVQGPAGEMLKEGGVLAPGAAGDGAEGALHGGGLDAAQPVSDGGIEGGGDGHWGQVPQEGEADGQEEAGVSGIGAGNAEPGEDRGEKDELFIVQGRERLMCGGRSAEEASVGFPVVLPGWREQGRGGFRWAWERAEQEGGDAFDEVRGAGRSGRGGVGEVGEALGIGEPGMAQEGADVLADTAGRGVEGCGSGGVDAASGEREGAQIGLDAGENGGDGEIKAAVLAGDTERVEDAFGFELI